MHRKSMLFTVFLFAVVAALLSSCITAPKISYQGKLTDPAGNPVADGDYNMTFRLWAPGSPDPVVVWQETQVVAVTDGLFNTTLGATTPLTPSIFTNQLELGVEVNGDGEMTPRQAIYGAPYAMTLVDGAVIAGARNLADDAEYPAMLNLFNGGDSYGLGIRFVGKAGLAITGKYLGNQYGAYGFLVDDVDYGGVITNTGGTGIYVESSGGGPENWWAFRGKGSQDGGGDGVFGWATGTGDHSTGLTGRSDKGYGIYAWSDLTGQYAGYFEGPIFVESCVGCTFHYLGRNVSSSMIQPGDAVSAAGVEAGLQGMQVPLFKVTLAQAGQSVLGVVVGQTTMTVADGSLDDVKAGAQFGPVGGPASPGDYLVIVVQGPAQVRADPAANIAAGSLVYLGTKGVTTAASGPAIGMALDAVRPDGLLWVLVGFR